MLKKNKGRVVGCSEGEEGDEGEGDGVLEMEVKAGVGRDMVGMMVGTGDWGDGSAESGGDEVTIVETIVLGTEAYPEVRTCRGNCAAGGGGGGWKQCH